jgi:hypothetical protein
MPGTSLLGTDKIFMIQAFHIKHWRELYERSDTRKAESMSWFAKRTKLIGLGIGTLMRQQYPDNVRLYGLWTFVEILASQSVPRHRGWLVRDGAPLDFEAMSALMPAIPPDAWKEICQVTCNPKIGWLEYIEFDADSPDGFPPDGKSSGHSPDGFPPDGKSSGHSPDGFPPDGKSSGHSDPTERETERELTDSKEREREDYTPSVAAVRSWAKENNVDPDFEKSIWRRKWESKLERFWKEDGEDWKKRQKKIPAPLGAKSALSIESMRAA